MHVKMAESESDTRCSVPNLMILPTTELKGSWACALFLTPSATLEDVQNQPGLKASHAPALSSQHRLGSQERKWADNCKARSEFSPGEWPRLRSQKGS